MKIDHFVAHGFPPEVIAHWRTGHAPRLLPLGEIGPSVERRKDKFLRQWLYPPLSRSAASELYEDAGEGMGYLAGDCRLSRFEMERAEDHLTVSWKRDGPYQPPYEHVELTLQGLRRAPRAIRADGRGFSVVSADPVRRSVLLGVPPFTKLEIEL